MSGEYLNPKATVGSSFGMSFMRGYVGLLVKLSAVGDRYRGGVILRWWGEKWDDFLLLVVGT